jgi:hypothetical protein
MGISHISDVIVHASQEKYMDLSRRMKSEMGGSSMVEVP